MRSEIYYAYNHAELLTEVTSSTIDQYVGSFNSDEPYRR